MVTLEVVANFKIKKKTSKIGDKKKEKQNDDNKWMTKKLTG